MNKIMESCTRILDFDDPMNNFRRLTCGGVEDVINNSNAHNKDLEMMRSLTRVDDDDKVNDLPSSGDKIRDITLYLQDSPTISDNENADNNNNNNYGIHLIKTNWDLYPRIDRIDRDSVAFKSNELIQRGDHVLEMNGKSLLGRMISEILDIFKESSNSNKLVLRLWYSGQIYPCPNLLSNMANLLGCPICLSSICRRPRQCRLGHLICSDCISKTSTCPICRVHLGRPNDKAMRGSRCLLAEKLIEILQDSGIMTMAATGTKCDRFVSTETHRQIQTTKAADSCIANINNGNRDNTTVNNNASIGDNNESNNTDESSTRMATNNYNNNSVRTANETIVENTRKNGRRKKYHFSVARFIGLIGDM